MILDWLPNEIYEYVILTFLDTYSFFNYLCTHSSDSTAELKEKYLILEKCSPITGFRYNNIIIDDDDELKCVAYPESVQILHTLWYCDVFCFKNLTQLSITLITFNDHQDEYQEKLNSILEIPSLTSLDINSCLKDYHIVIESSNLIRLAVKHQMSASSSTVLGDLPKLNIMKIYSGEISWKPDAVVRPPLVQLIWHSLVDLSYFPNTLKMLHYKRIDHRNVPKSLKTILQSINDRAFQPFCGLIENYVLKVTCCPSFGILHVPASSPNAFIIKSHGCHDKQVAAYPQILSLPNVKHLHIFAKNSEVIQIGDISREQFAVQVSKNTLVSIYNSKQEILDYMKQNLILADTEFY